MIGDKVDMRYSYIMDDLESLKSKVDITIESIKSIFGDQPRYYRRIGGEEQHYIEARYEILTPREQFSGKYIIPKKEFIPQEYWDNEVDSKIISWKVK